MSPSSSSLKSDSPSPSPTPDYTIASSSTIGPSTYAAREDEYADLENEAGELLSEPQPDDDERKPPWAKLVNRSKRALYRLPGVERIVDVTNKILGPKTQRPPPLPTKTALMCAVTSGRRRVSTTLDTLCVRLTRSLYLDYFWLLFLAVWVTGFVLLIRSAYYASGPETINCTATMWENWPPDVCGLGGQDCFGYLEPGTYRCPGGCQNVPLGNPRWVGGEEVNGRPLLIGGVDGSPYRADSWICAAGIQQGFVSPTYGGCVRVQPLAFPLGHNSFKAGKSRGLQSVAFNSSFPAAYTLEQAGSVGQCMEYHWPITAYNVVMLFVFTAFFAPPPAVLTTVLFLGGFLQITLVSDPPNRPPDWSKIIGGVLPVFFAGYWAWKVSLCRTLTGFYEAKLPFETALWQGFGYWIGIESDTLFAKIPISRLGYNHLSADGIISLIAVIIFVFVVVLIQALSMRRLGLVRYYLVRYLPLVPILIILANLGHDFYLRPHHYMVSLAGFPVLSLPNRISLFGQAFVTGWFLDGVGRWGWASLVEGGTSLLGDAAAGSLLPNITTTSDLVSWPALNTTLVADGIIGVAIIFDDILIRREFNGTNFTIEDGTPDRMNNHFLRMAYVGNGTSLDFTDPLTWYASNQSWAEVSPSMLETRSWWRFGL